MFCVCWDNGGSHLRYYISLVSEDHVHWSHVRGDNSIGQLSGDLTPGSHPWISCCTGNGIRQIYMYIRQVRAGDEPCTIWSGNRMQLPFRVFGKRVRQPCVRLAARPNPGAFEDTAVMDFCVCRMRSPHGNSPVTSLFVELQSSRWSLIKYNGVGRTHAFAGDMIMCLHAIAGSDCRIPYEKRTHWVTALLPIHRLRRWPSRKPAWGKRLIFAGDQLPITFIQHVWITLISNLLWLADLLSLFY